MSCTYILSARRTPCGTLLGELSSLTAPQLGAVALRAVIADAPDTAEDIEEILMGCVLPAGIGQAPARQAARAAGLSDSVPATTVNKMCGSGMKTVMQADDAITAGRLSVVAAGGMESMSRAPHILSVGRRGIRLGNAEVSDHMLIDGLRDAYEDKLMGAYAQDTADNLGFSREEMDIFAIESTLRARAAFERGDLKEEMAPVTIVVRGKEQTIIRDEQPSKSDIDKIPTLKPAFAKNGTITAANSSCISDGAAALILSGEEYAHKRKTPPLARIVAQATHAREPKDFTIAPGGAVSKVLSAAGWTAAETDLFEINEAFAVVAMAAMREHDIPHEKVNIHGGAVAVGHPVGASGARIIVSLLTALQKRGGKRGVASLCIGGGEATAVAVELCQ